MKETFTCLLVKYHRMGKRLKRLQFFGLIFDAFCLSKWNLAIVIDSFRVSISWKHSRLEMWSTKIMQPFVFFQFFHKIDPIHYYAKYKLLLSQIFRLYLCSLKEKFKYLPRTESPATSKRSKAAATVGTKLSGEQSIFLSNLIKTPKYWSCHVQHTCTHF